MAQLNSWDGKIEPLTLEERGGLEGMHPTCGCGGSARCCSVALYKVSFTRYARRNGSAYRYHKLACITHAASFAARHSIAVPADVTACAK